jgi:hypothetical protein
VKIIAVWSPVRPVMLENVKLECAAGATVGLAAPAIVTPPSTSAKSV